MARDGTASATVADLRQGEAHLGKVQVGRPSRGFSSRGRRLDRPQAVGLERRSAWPAHREQQRRSGCEAVFEACAADVGRSVDETDIMGSVVARYLGGETPSCGWCAWEVAMHRRSSIAWAFVGGDVGDRAPWLTPPERSATSGGRHVSGRGLRTTFATAQVQRALQFRGTSRSAPSLSLSLAQMCRGVLGRLALVKRETGKFVQVRWRVTGVGRPQLEYGAAAHEMGASRRVLMRSGCPPDRR